MLATVVAPTAHAADMRLSDAIYALAYSGDGSRLAAGGLDGEIKVWELSGNALVTETAVEQTVAAMSLSHDGRRLLANQEGMDPRASLIDVDTGQISQQYMLGTRSRSYVSLGSSIGFSPDGARVILGNTTASGAGIFDTDSGELVARFDGGKPRQGDCAINDGWSTLVCTYDGPSGFRTEGHAELTMWNVASGEQIADFSLEPLRDAGNVRFLDERRIVVGDSCMNDTGCGVAVVDLETQTITRQFNPLIEPGEEVGKFNQPLVQAIAISADGKRIAAGDEWGRYAVWRLAPLELLGIGKVSEQRIRAVALSPDGRHVAVAGDDGQVHVRPVHGD
ncbi:WD40 repeat domain-containing protein [Marilutibacter maris]|uniref:WD40 repeat domain-containing protein n=1 Tax=Marilutibacter maris TaxID=1605891 RepID=UPI00167CAB2C|nr:hypothetical protein [Lysobacter maris]